MTLVERTTDPQLASGFAALRLGEPVQRALDEIGYSEPTPVQAAAYPLAIAGRDIIVQARTGTGKTAAFGIPLVDKLVTSERHAQALVLAPTRELALQSQREIARIGQHKRIHVVAIYGGAPMGKQVEELQSGAQIVSGTPGRVLDHLRRGTFDPSHLRVLILDEMDEMLSMGFAKELSAILELIPDRSKRQTMCFSATVDGEVRRHAERHMNDPEMVSLSSDAVGVEQITHFAYMVPGSDRPADLVRILEVEDPESAIIFCNMRSETERVAGALQAAGFNADWLNGDLPQRDRERIMEATRQGKLRYLVATDVAARGIDISHLTHVINYTFPESAAVYVHRTGRTGRAGRTGSAVSLVSPDELGRLYYLRLEYKISPIERSLPTRGELKTRTEMDRILLLENAFSAPPAANDLAVARRLLTHPDVERILGGLLHTFLGTHDEVDEEAAAVRRTRNPTPVEPERPSPEGRRRDEQRGRDEGPGRDEGREGGRRRRRRGRGDRDEAPVRDAPLRDDARADRPRNDRPRDDRSGEGQPSVEEGGDNVFGENAAAEGVAARSGEGARPTGDDRPRQRDRDRDRPRRDRDDRRGARGPREGFSGRDREGREGASRELPGRDSARREPGGLDHTRESAGRDASSARPGELGEQSSGRDESAPQTGPWSREDAYGVRDANQARTQDREAGRPRRERGRRDRYEGGAPRPRRERDAALGGSGSNASAGEARDGVLFDDRPEAQGQLFGGDDPNAFPDPPTSRDLTPPAGIDADAEDNVWGDEPAPQEPQELGGLLYLNLGRRDGVRINEVARLLRDQCGLRRAEVGRIRVRDRYTYVDVPQERLDAIIESLRGHTFHDKTLSPERARVVKT